MDLRFVTLSVMLFAAIAFATTAFIQPPRLSYTFYVKEGKVNTFPGSVKIENRNDFPVTVVFSKPSWVDMASSVQLQAGESRNVSFSMIFTEAGNYNGDITATYTASGRLSAPASAELIVNAIYNGTYVNANPPNTPQLSAPIDGYRTHGKILTLQWSASSDPDGDTVIYYYYVDDSSAFNSPEFFGSISSTSQQLELQYKTYYWKIAATDGKYNSSSAVRSFVVGNDPPAAPQLLAPADNAQLGIPPLLEWSASSDIDNDAVRYEILVDDDANFNVPIIKKTAENKYDLNGIISQGTWHWKVRADDGTAKSESQTRSFTFSAAATTTTTSTTTMIIQIDEDNFNGSDEISHATTTTTIAPQGDQAPTSTTVTENPLTVSVIRGSSAVEIIIIVFIVISTAIGAVFLVRR